jgi:hypothetical protein
MMTVMDERARRRQVAVVAGVGGCLLLAVATAPVYLTVQGSFVGTTTPLPIKGLGWVYTLAPIVATVAALCAVRWWPYLLLAAAVVTGALVLYETGHAAFPPAVAFALSGGYPLAIVGVLACAQGLLRGEAEAWGAALAGLAVGGRLAGTVLAGSLRSLGFSRLPAVYVVLVVVGLAGVLPAARWYPRGDPAAVGPPGDRPWRRARLIVPAALAACLPVPLSFVTTGQLAALLGVTRSTLAQHSYVEVAAFGAITVAVVTVLAAVAGLWPLGGALTAATVQVAALAPLVLALTALADQDPVRWLAGLAGVALGAATAATRLRVPLAAALTAVAAIALFVAYGAAGGEPAKLLGQRGTVPEAAILVLIAAAATAMAGAAAPALAPRGVLPAALGPFAVMLGAGGLELTQALDVPGDRPVSPYLQPLQQLPISAVLLLAAGAGIVGLGLARRFAVRRPERERVDEVAPSLHSG